MTSSFNQFEQPGLPSIPTAQISPLQLESFNQIPAALKRPATEPVDLVVGDIWAVMKNPEAACPTSSALDKKSGGTTADEPNYETIRRLSFDRTGSISNFSTAQDVEKITSDIKRAQKSADSHEAQYKWERRPGNGPINPPQDGDDPAKYTHVNSDRSSYTVTNGKISGFQTAPTRDQPHGVKYSEIKYDAEGLVKSYSNSLGQTYLRIGIPDRGGVALWKSTDTDEGKPEADESRRWKVVVDANGIHIMIGGDNNRGTMFSRLLDGSQVLTQRKNGITGFETVTTLPDNTKVSGRGTFNRATRSLDRANTVDLKEAEGKYYTNIPVRN